MGQIFITSAAYQDVASKVNIELVQQLLDEVEVSDYSNQVKGINFIFIVVTDTSYHPETLEYDSEERSINIHAQLAYEEVKEAGEKETIYLMKKLFVDWIDRFSELTLDFDSTKFKKDIEGLFGLQQEEVLLS